jgi:hypothetical protein
MLAKQFHKPSPSHHHFDRWYKLTIPSHGWFMTLFYPHLVQSSEIIFQYFPTHQKLWFQGAKADHEIPQCAGSRR